MDRSIVLPNCPGVQSIGLRFACAAVSAQRVLGFTLALKECKVTIYNGTIYIIILAAAKMRYWKKKLEWPISLSNKK